MTGARDGYDDTFAGERQPVLGVVTDGHAEREYEPVVAGGIICTAAAASTGASTGVRSS
ncbi:hypothetical protein ACFVTP_29510 [Streptomyces celluloflavus]|uniref:hypothetical protein n=1 Tax=Streptomyces celluloflavus TaxID=58344 RepID=UPI0036DD691F